MIRAFIAIDLTDEVRAELAAAQSRLRRMPLGVRVSWVKLANLHLTLQFLGYVEEGIVPAVRLALSAVVGCRAPFDLEVNGLGAFPVPDRPRVLWAGCSAGTAEVASLARAVQQATEPLGFTPETRPFAAHLTIGRVKAPRPDRTLTRGLDSLKNAAFGTVRVEALHLYQSELHPAGSIYTRLSSHPLTGD